MCQIREFTHTIDATVEFEVKKDVLQGHTLYHVTCMVQSMQLRSAYLVDLFSEATRQHSLDRTVDSHNLLHQEQAENLQY